jgi:hypothetical protein
VRVESPSHPKRPMARGAVALRMTAHARVQAPLGFERVMARPRGRIAPGRFGGVKSPGIPRRGRTRLGDAGLKMALETEPLLSVAALASLGVHPRFDRVHVQVVVRVDGAGSNAPVVAVGAELILVACGAERGIVSSHVLVPLQEVRRVLGIP